MTSLNPDPVHPDLPPALQAPVRQTVDLIVDCTPMVDESGRTVHELKLRIGALYAVLQVPDGQVDLVARMIATCLLTSKKNADATRNGIMVVPANALENLPHHPNGRHP